MNNPKTCLKIGIICLIMLIIGSYSLFEARKIMTGPDIAISSPSNGAILYDSLVDVVGVAKNIKEISVNDRPIFIDENGNFNEKLLLYPGYNIIKLKAKDKFGNETEKEIQNILRTN